MRKIYYLSTCSTCQRIMKETGVEGFELQDIKTSKISTEQLEQMRSMTDSYESLFSRRSMQYRARDLHTKSLTEGDYHDLILDEYTFLKRPVYIIDEEIFIGNTKATVAAIKAKLGVD